MFMARRTTKKGYACSTRAEKVPSSNFSKAPVSCRPLFCVNSGLQLQSLAWACGMGMDIRLWASARRSAASARAGKESKRRVLAPLFVFSRCNLSPFLFSPSYLSLDDNSAYTMVSYPSFYFSVMRFLTITKTKVYSQCYHASPDGCWTN